MMVVVRSTRMMELETLILCPCTGVSAAEDYTVPSKEPQTGLNGQPAF